MIAKYCKHFHAVLFLIRYEANFISEETNIFSLFVVDAFTNLVVQSSEITS